MIALCPLSSATASLGLNTLPRLQVREEEELGHWGWEDSSGENRGWDMDGALGSRVLQVGESQV